MDDRFRRQQFNISKKIIRSFPINPKRFHGFQIAAWFIRSLFLLPALYLPEEMDSSLLGEAFPKGHPVSGGKALFYYGPVSSLNSDELLTAALPLLLITGLIALGVYRVIRNHWDENIRNEVQNE